MNVKQAADWLSLFKNTTHKTERRSPWDRTEFPKIVYLIG